MSVPGALLTVPLLLLQGRFPGAASDSVALKEGENLNLNCTFSSPSSNNFTLQWLNPRNFTIFLNAQQVLRDQRYQLLRYAQGELSIQLSNLSQQDEGIYRCLHYTRHVQTKSQRVEILAAPSPPELELSQGEGRGVQLCCHSQGGRPQPQISWLLDGGIEVPGDTRHQLGADGKSWSTRSTLRILSYSPGVTASCIIQHPALGPRSLVATFPFQDLPSSGYKQASRPSEDAEVPSPSENPAVSSSSENPAGTSPSASPGNPELSSPSESPGNPELSSPSASPGNPELSSPSASPGNPELSSPSASPGNPELSSPSASPGNPELSSPSASPGNPELSSPSASPGNPELSSPSASPGNPEVSSPSATPNDLGVSSLSTSPGNPEDSNPSASPENPEICNPSASPKDPEDSGPSATPGNPELSSPSASPKDPGISSPSASPKDPEVSSPSATPNDPGVSSPSATPENPELSSPSASPENPEVSSPSACPGNPAAPSSAPAQPALTDVTLHEQNPESKGLLRRERNLLLPVLVAALVLVLLLIVLLFVLKLRKAHGVWKRENDVSEQTLESYKSRSNEDSPGHEKNGQAGNPKSNMQYVTEGHMEAPEKILEAPGMTLEAPGMTLAAPEESPGAQSRAMTEEMFPCGRETDV